jgi:hypothetical protein
MPTGLRTDPEQPRLTASEAARAELRWLQQRQRDLPEVMREAAAAGRTETVIRLRTEYDQMPVKLWSAEYTAVQAELAERGESGRAQPRRPELLNRARELVAELYLRPAYPGLRPQ